MWTLRAELSHGGVVTVRTLHARGAPSSWSEDASALSCSEADSIDRVRWILAVDACLDHRDPMASYNEQLRLCRSLSEDVLGLYDGSSFKFFTRRELLRLTEMKVPPRIENLISVHAVSAGKSIENNGFWMHTHGLHRAGRPEIDLVGVPDELYAAGATLINAAADLIVGSESSPAAGEAFGVAFGGKVAWLPWDEAVANMPARTLGGARDRRDGLHGGHRFVLTDPKGVRSSSNWFPPIDLLERLDRESAVPYRSRRETERMATIAKDAWPEFAMLLSKHNARWRFIVKLGFPASPQGPDSGVLERSDHDREHLWFEVKEIVPDRVRGVLLSEPVGSGKLVRGEEAWHELDALTDWTIATPLGVFSPEDVQELWEMVSE